MIVQLCFVLMSNIVNCQKACKKCDVGRPCQRCIKYGLTETCVNSVRKERKKGVKRGPYKKRNKNGESLISNYGNLSLLLICVIRW